MDTTQNALASFVDLLLAEKQFDRVDMETKSVLRNDLQSRLEDHINAALLSELSEEQVKEFEQLLDAKSSSVQLQEFLAARIPHMDQVIAATLIRFRSLYNAS